MKSDKRIPFFLILRHLRRVNKWTLALIVVLLAIAFINLVFINSLFNGVIESNNNQIIAFRTGNIDLTPVKGQEFINDAARLTDKIEKIRGVTAAAPETEVTGSLDFKGTRGDYPVTAIDPDSERRVTQVANRIVKGSYLDSQDHAGMIIGAELAGEKDNGARHIAFSGVKVGDRLTLTVGSQRREFTVRGIFKTKSDRADNRTFITRTALQSLAPESSGRASNILIKTEKTGNEIEMVARLRAAGVKGTFITWQEVARSLKTLTDSFVTINALLTVVGFFIAAVTIFIIIYVDITHRRQEIGILRAVGVKAKLVISTYLMQGAVYTFFGVALGTALYFGCAYPYFQAYPFQIPIGDVTLSVNPGDFVFRALTVIAVGVLSALIPAIIATRKGILDDILGR